MMSLPTILMPTYSSPSKAPRAVRNTRSVRQPRISFSNPESSPTVAFDDNQKWKLFITTNSKICAWDYKGCEPIFTSSSRGIVAAKRAQDGSVLAIADAQVVMLHQMKDGQDKSYRLRGTQRCRLLQYSHDSRNLFYTDSLHNNVQSYSLSENLVADAAKSHPSPITAFAISCDSNLILSASADPSVIQIHNQLLATTLSLAPSASSVPVVTCAFHPSRKHLFMLAFGDGVLAAYDYNKLPTVGEKKINKKENVELGMTRCHARAIHAFRHLHDPSIAGSAGITGAGFVPGQRSRAVTVGEDGRCFLVDFEKGDTLGSWHIGAPATGLTIREISLGAKSKNDLGGYFIAIGTVHGRCVIYDGNGNKIAERIIDVEGESVLDVEWVYGDVSLPEGDVLSLSDPISAAPSPRKSTSVDQLRNSERSKIHPEKLVNPTTPLYGRGLNPTVVLPAPAQEECDTLTGEGPQEIRTKRRYRTFSPPVYDSFEDTADQGYMKLFSPVKRKRASKSSSLPEKAIDKSNKKPSDPRLRATTLGSDHRSVISAPLLWEDKIQANENTNRNMSPTVEENGFGAFQTGTQKETLTPGNTLPGTKSNSNSVSIFERLSSVPGEQIKMEEKTDDGRILSEIRSIRAKVSGKSKNSSRDSPPAVAYLPTNVRSTPISRVGLDPARNRSIRRSASVPEKKTHPGDLHNSNDGGNIERDNQSVMSPIHDVLQVPTEESNGQYPNQEALQEEISTEEDEDIWLAQTISSRASRRRSLKRKKATLEDEETTAIVAYTSPENRTDLSRSVSTRSSKSRKTVSWSDEHDLRAPDNVFPTPVASSSVAGEYGDASASSSYLGSSRPLSTPSQHRIISTHAAVTTGTAVQSRQTISENSAKSIDEIVKTALAEMQAAMSREMRAMQAEMQRQFREQNHELQGLKNEMGRVREENQKLRNMLFKSSGVRDSVKKNGGPSVPLSK